MNRDISVLRALMRLSFRRAGADVDALTVRTAASRGEVRDALRRLENDGLVTRRADADARLTLAGLAVAVAAAKAQKPSTGVVTRAARSRVRATRRRAA